jgi:hypothetical protein
MIIFRAVLSPPRARSHDKIGTRAATHDASTNATRSLVLKSTMMAGILRKNTLQNDLEFREAAE